MPRLTQLQTYALCKAMQVFFKKTHGMLASEVPSLGTLDIDMLDTISSYLIVDSTFGAFEYVRRGFRPNQTCIVLPGAPCKYALSFAYKPHQCRGTAFLFCGLGGTGKSRICNQLLRLPNTHGMMIRLSDLHDGIAVVFDGLMYAQAGHRRGIFPFFQMHLLRTIRDLTVGLCCFRESADGAYLKEVLDMLLRRDMEVFAFSCTER